MLVEVHYLFNSRYVVFLWAANFLLLKCMHVGNMYKMFIKGHSSELHGQEKQPERCLPKVYMHVGIGYKKPDDKTYFSTLNPFLITHTNL